MSVDQRLRTGLHAQAAASEVDAQAALHRVEQRVRRARRRTRWASAAVVAAASVGAVAVGPSIVDRIEDQRLPAARNEGPLAGTYVVEVPDTPAHRRLQLTGRWVVTFRPDGELHLDPPEGYVGSTAGTRYEVVDDELLRTDALIDMPGCQASADDLAGTYRWEEFGDNLLFTVVSDGCRARVDLLTGQLWRGQ